MPVKSTLAWSTSHFCVLNIPSEQNAKNEHKRKPHHHWMPRNRSATHQPTRQAGKIPGPTAGMENRFIKGMSHSRHHATM